MAFALIISYLIGAIPFALIVGRIASGKDIRQYGSGNLGGTNAIRVLGKKAGSLVIAADILKGMLTTWLGLIITGNELGALLAGLMAAVGHSYPIYANFKGGKGVAVGTGIYLVLAPTACLIAFLIFFLTILISKYVSLASINAALAISVLVWFYKMNLFLILLTWALAFFVIYRHRGNIKRILNGTENKVKF